MGLGKDLRKMVKEYKQDPRGQYFRNLDKMLNLNVTGKVTKKEVLEHVQEWAKK
jgi:hypothetical protein